MFERIKALWSVDSRLGSFRQVIRESFTGAWQRNVEVDTRENVLRFGAVYACVNGIAGDIAKLEMSLMREDGEIMVRQKTGRYADLLKKPNTYQTRFQFVQSWVLSKLLTGNAYVLKERNLSGVIVGLHVLDSEFVTVLVSDSGDVYYQIKRDNLTRSTDITIPATEVMHDRAVTLYHPLVGISPLYACGMSATLGNAILQTGAGFFKNKATPGGILTAPGRISDDTAARLKQHWSESYTGSNAGKIAVLGDGLKFERMTVSAVDAQLIEQLRFSIEDVARCFRYPLYKLQAGAPLMAGSAEELNLQYYGDALQPLIEAAEAVMNDGLELPSTLHVEFDLSGLARMNTSAQIEAAVAGVRGSIYTHNEARAKLNLPPKAGGDELMAQQQDYTLPDLAALRERERLQTAQQPAAPTVVEEPDEANDDEPDEAAEQQTRALLDALRKGLLENWSTK